MPLYVCSKCNVIENTVWGNYWFIKNKKKALCSECLRGKWHDGRKNTFSKEYYNPEKWVKEKLTGFVERQSKQEE